MAEQNWGIVPCDVAMDVSPANGFTKLELNSTQKIQVGALLQQLPSVAVTNKMSQLYTVTFPEGISGKLMELKQREGFTTSIIGEDGKIAASAALNPVDHVQVLAMGCFTAMSIASSQYFLKKINDELKVMRMTIDKILEFLYGDKKAELMAEINFVRYAYEKYIFIMRSDAQRAATIASLQSARKVAIKDIEFYIADLESTVKGKEGKDISSLVEKEFQLKESLEVAMQLYGVSSLLEVYYAQNYDRGYLEYVERDISVYIDKCEKRMLGSFSSLRTLVDNAKEMPFKKIAKADILDRIDGLVESLGRGEESDMRKSLRAGLNAATQKADYYMTVDGVIYLKTA
ncbi:hypothetical protein [uncultured Parasutterella sp.]|uniref:hypothetical protein n=1 Tax=uncultured Parasutterella sp. TaxID=1263098 RepID=UPI002627E70C|nr:hypothetical protein [uncultured Parasutterella sp.]